jgi:hypothetical protein
MPPNPPCVCPDPPGPDHGFAALRAGERVLNEKQWRLLAPETRAEIDAVFAKTDAAGTRPDARRAGYAEGGVVTRRGLLDDPPAEGPFADSDVYLSPFAPDAGGSGPRGPGGRGFGVPEAMMAPMPVLAPDSADRMEITPELLALLRRLARKPANRLVR